MEPSIGIKSEQVIRSNYLSQKAYLNTNINLKRFKGKIILELNLREGGKS
ncbi:hypothetical protein [Priestia endophytica]|nr:hypothetical protein [Priestia endophytica]